MKAPCETASRYLLPSMRALIARKLIENYEFTQQNAALRLDMTQSAMSKYLSEKRGAVINVNKEIDELTSGIAKKIYEGKMSPEEFVEQLCNICMKYRKDENVCIKH